MTTYRIVATRTIFLTTEIEAESIDDAYEQIDNGGFELDWANANGDIQDDIIVEENK